MRNKAKSSQELLKAFAALGIKKNTEAKKRPLDVVANTPTLVANVVANTVANKEMVANSVVANKDRGKDRHKDKEARKAYQRELMRKRRAEAKKR